MNHSIATADRMTHLKIVVVALIGATLVAGVGIAARVSDDNVRTAVVKAGKPVTVTSSGAFVVR